MTSGKSDSESQLFLSYFTEHRHSDLSRNKLKESLNFQSAVTGHILISHETPFSDQGKKCDRLELRNIITYKGLGSMPWVMTGLDLRQFYPNVVTSNDLAY